MKSIATAAALFWGLCAPLCLNAQQSPSDNASQAAAVPVLTINGTVTDAATGQTMPGANITLKQEGAAFLKSKGSLTDAEGTFRFRNVAAGAYTLKVSFLGYVSQVLPVTAESAAAIVVKLVPQGKQTDEATVTATRAGEKTPIAFTNVDKKELSGRNLGQDLPSLLQFTPSVVVNSDGGTGIGYSDIKVRGADASRTSVTINGIPYNDAESQQTYFVDLPDFASSVQNVQIQRGAGTSTNGAGALGATINIQTEQQHFEPYAEANNSFGSFNTFKNTFKFGTGLINNRWSFDGRLSKIASNGYINRSASDLQSFYASGGYYGKKSFLKLIVFSGKELTHQAWNGVPQDSLAAGNRTYNELGYYANHIDNYQQDNYQLHFNTAEITGWELNAALHYTKGFGYWEEYKKGQNYADYGLPKPDSTLYPHGYADTIVRQRWLNNNFYGATASAVYTSDKLTLTLGGAANRYTGDHYGIIVWGSSLPANLQNHQYYLETSTKDDANGYIKALWSVTPALSIFADMQVRYVNYQLSGVTALTQAGATATVNLTKPNTFFNPKAGLSYALGGGSLYASYSAGHKELSRQDLINANLGIGTAANAEQLHDFEAGYRGKAGLFSYGINGYYMLYKNQLVNSGGFDINGNYLRVNADQSYRRGIELEGTIQIAKGLSWAANLTLSQNRITKFTETLNNFDANYNSLPDSSKTFNNTPISFSPSVIAASRLTYSPVQGASITLLTKHVGQQYLDLTGNPDAQINAYFRHDVRLAYTFAALNARQIEATLLINNITNALYSSSGATYPDYEAGKKVLYNYYFPQATVNFLAGISVLF